jgi:GNAT superfamily N-acetyltransferase
MDSLPHVTIEIEDPDIADADWCRQQYFAEIDALLDTGYDPAHGLRVTSDDFRLPHGVFLMARLDGRAVGMGSVKHHPGEPALIKRMWVSPAARGMGVAGNMLTMLEDSARAAGAAVIRLDTSSVLPAACRMYESRGYVEVPRFNDEQHADRWYSKELG